MGNHGTYSWKMLSRLRLSYDDLENNMVFSTLVIDAMGHSGVDIYRYYQYALAYRNIDMYFQYRNIFTRLRSRRG